MCWHCIDISCLRASVCYAYPYIYLLQCMQLHSSMVSVGKMLLFDLITDVLQAAGFVESAYVSKQTTSARTSTLGQSQSSRQRRPASAHTGKGSILGDREIGEEVGVFSRARHASLLSMKSSYRATPLMEPATAFESGLFAWSNYTGS